MKHIILTIFFFTFISGFSQEKSINRFMFDKKEVIYSRIDYSQYGVGHFFITLYEDLPENKAIETRAENYLGIVERLYHTLYFFIKVPVESTLEQKEKLLIQFVEVLKAKENINKLNLFINLDAANTTPDFITQLNKNNFQSDKIRIKTKINSKNIWKNLIN